MSTPNITWRRMASGDGYETDGAKVWDNGNGFGSARNSGRWAVEVRGEWIANVDYLADAKAKAAEMLAPPAYIYALEERRGHDVTVTLTSGERVEGLYMGCFAKGEEISAVELLVRTGQPAPRHMDRRVIDIADIAQAAPTV